MGFCTPQWLSPSKALPANKPFWMLFDCEDINPKEISPEEGKIRSKSGDLH